MELLSSTLQSRRIGILALLLICGTGCNAQQFPTTADSRRQSGVPQGKVFEFTFDRSRLFPGTTRTVTVYVPAQYRGDKPACVYVGLDALSFAAPTVFDNLIHRGDMPVTIGIGLAPGTVESARPAANPRFNRSLEFDGLDDTLARFLLEEILPEVERHQTPDGIPILLSKDPNDRAAGGASTGGIGSFTLAWERPDAFRRVFTAIGTFVGMRGGDRYPVLIRKTEPKPIRIFLQDGSNDGLPGFIDEAGDWWMGNQAMQRALQFSGYEVRHAWGEGGHDPKHAASVFPDAMRWLWKDWPKPIVAGQSANSVLRAILAPTENWRLASNEQAEHARGSLTLMREGQHWNTADREYWVETSAGEIWLKNRDGSKWMLDSGLKAPTAIALSPDGLWLAVAERRSHFGYSYRVRGDGSVEHRQKFYWLHVPDSADDPDIRAWVFDSSGQLYAATNLGVQILDRNGRTRAILPLPGGPAEAIGFGGQASDVLYAMGRDGMLYARKLKIKGILPGSAPMNWPKSSPW